MRDLGAQALKSTPSYALTLVEQALQEMDSATDLNLVGGLFGAEPWTKAMRPAIERGLGLQAINDYGLSEVIGPGVSGECIEARSGMHLQEDHFLPEVIDPYSCRPLPAGQSGELADDADQGGAAAGAVSHRRRCFTRLRGMRVRPVVCPGTLAVNGRLDDMLIIRGVNLYPTEVERVVLGVPELGTNYQLVVERLSTLDELTVVCELSANNVDADGLRGRVAHAIQQAIGLAVNVQLVAGALPQSEGKAIRVVDRRTSR